MSVDVNKLLDKFLNKMNDMYNSEVYFVDSCVKFPDKSSAPFSLMDLSLQLYFEKNNKIIFCGECVKFCTKDSKRKLKILTLSDVDSPDVIVNNYIIDDTWNKIDW